MDSFEIAELPGTENAYGPFFSPNGRWVGFFVGNQLKKVRIDGGEPVVIAAATNSVGADWSEDGRIVFSGYEGDGLRVVSASIDGTVRVWDAESGDELRRFDGHPHQQSHSR